MVLSVRVSLQVSYLSHIGTLGIQCRVEAGHNSADSTSHHPTMAAPGAPASPLLDSKQPFDVNLLDSTIKAFYGAGSNQEVRKPFPSQQHRLRLQRSLQFSRHQVSCAVCNIFLRRDIARLCKADAVELY